MVCLTIWRKPTFRKEPQLSQRFRIGTSSKMCLRRRLDFKQLSMMLWEDMRTPFRGCAATGITNWRWGNRFLSVHPGRGSRAGKLHKNYQLDEGKSFMHLQEAWNLKMLSCHISDVKAQDLPARGPLICRHLNYGAHRLKVSSICASLRPPWNF